MGADDFIIRPSKVIEIKRGELVPKNSKWLKEKIVEVIDSIEANHHSMLTHFVIKKHEEIYDVFQVENNE